MSSAKPKLIILVGISGSGKSNTAIELAEKYDAKVVSTDKIREEICGRAGDQSKNVEVFIKFHDTIHSHLENGENVIADATNITIKSRANILKLTLGLNVEKICYILAKPFNLCLNDNLTRIEPVPENVILHQEERFQIPFYEEGYDEIIISSQPSWRALSYQDLLAEMSDYNQYNPHHTKTLGEHCHIAAKEFKTKMPYLSKGFYIGAALHDVGKMYTQTFDDEGIAHYYQHHCVGTYRVLSEMLMPYEEFTPYHMLNCCFLINYHMMPFNWKNDKTYKKWWNIFGDEKYNMLLRFHEADIVAK